MCLPVVLPVIWLSATAKLHAITKAVLMPLFSQVQEAWGPLKQDNDSACCESFGGLCRLNLACYVLLLASLAFRLGLCTPLLMQDTSCLLAALGVPAGFLTAPILWGCVAPKYPKKNVKRCGWGCGSSITRVNWMHAAHFFTVWGTQFCAGQERWGGFRVVQNSLQSRLDAKDTPKWVCECGSPNLAGWSHCTKCGRPPRQDRELRMQARAIQGLGRGGGYFERTVTESRSSEDLQKVKGGLDIYGRTRTKSMGGSESASPAAERRKEAAANDAKEAKGDTKEAKGDTKADRQKAALERLRNIKKKRDELSPPRTRVYREKSSRSRSLERRRESTCPLRSGLGEETEKLGRVGISVQGLQKAGMFRTKTFQQGGYEYFFRVDTDLFFVEAPVVDPFKLMAATWQRLVEMDGL
eukprot:s1293_g22.t1